jgi:hypothetical protein
MLIFLPVFSPRQNYDQLNLRSPPHIWGPRLTRSVTDGAYDLPTTGGENESSLELSLGLDKEIRNSYPGRLAEPSKYPQLAERRPSR